MALIVLPDGIMTVANEHHLDYSRQIVIESQWSAVRTFLNRSYPEWIGQLHLGRTEEEDTGMAIEGWLSAFDGRANTVNIPLHRTTLPNTCLLYTSPSPRDS